MRLRQGIRIQGWETPLILLGVVILCYGLWIPWLGLFGDDLSYLYYYHLLGAWGPGSFASDRPISGLFYAVSMGLLGESVWPYQVLLLGLRWLSAVLLWWVLCLVWPERKREAAAAALLFAVYPGFRQNPIALEFILHFFVLDLFLLSLGAMILSICRPQQAWRYRTMSLVGASGMFMLEYFFGLEILRPILLWLVTRREGLKGRMQWKRIWQAWLPALLVTAAFLIWRVFIFAFPTYKPVLLADLRTHPISALISLVQRIAQDIWVSLGGAWLQTIHFPNDRRSMLIYLALGLATVALVGLLWWRLAKSQSMRAEKNYQGEILLGLGLLSMLAGGGIFWLTSIPVTLEFPWDRSTLALMLGASLAVAGLLQMLVTPRYQGWVLGGLIALAVGMHFSNAQEYRAEWNMLQDFYWQLTWRAPQMAPGTLVMFDVIPLNRYSDNDMTAMLNWTYAPNHHSRQTPYKFFDLTLRLDSMVSGLPGLAKDLPVEHNHRGLFFKTTTSNTLALTYAPPACLKVLDPTLDKSLPNLPERITRVLPMTRIEQVQAAHVSAHPPSQLGAEPAHGWCYYFQKADLARQQQDWAAVASMGDQAAEANLHPGDASELLPFIEGYALAGKVDQAAALTQQARKQPALQPALCQVWQRVASSSTVAKQAAAAQSELGCKF